MVSKLATRSAQAATNLAGGRSGCRCLGKCFVKACVDTREFRPNLSVPPGQIIRRQSRTDPWRPGGGPRSLESCGGLGRQISLRLSGGGGGAAPRGKPPIVEDTGRNSRHRSSHSKLSQRQSPQQSQRSLTAAVAAHLAYSRNQPVYHTLNQSR